jgi:hypothetical protein
MKVFLRFSGFSRPVLFPIVSQEKHSHPVRCAFCLQLMGGRWAEKAKGKRQKSKGKSEESGMRARWKMFFILAF